MRTILPPFRLMRDERGATIIEFAMILPALCVLLLGIFELGYRSYAASVVQGALHEAARMATVGGVPMDDIDERVRARLSNFAGHGIVEIETSSYYEFSGVATPEQITSDSDPIGEYNEEDCYLDTNRNGQWDADSGSDGLGGSEDIVRYQVSLTVPTIVPIGGLLGWSDENRIAGSTVLRNQPYAGRTGPVTTPTCPE